VSDRRLRRRSCDLWRVEFRIGDQIRWRLSPTDRRGRARRGEEVELEARGLEDLEGRCRNERGCLKEGGSWGGNGKGGDEEDELAALTTCG